MMMTIEALIHKLSKLPPNTNVTLDGLSLKIIDNRVFTARIDFGETREFDSLGGAIVWLIQQRATTFTISEYPNTGIIVDVRDNVRYDRYGTPLYVGD